METFVDVVEKLAEDFYQKKPQQKVFRSWLTHWLIVDFGCVNFKWHKLTSFCTTALSLASFGLCVEQMQLENVDIYLRPKISSQFAEL